MTEHLKTTLLWLTTSGMKIAGILVALLFSPHPFVGRNQKRTQFSMIIDHWSLIIVK
jgi:hypothetical protein